MTKDLKVGDSVLIVSWSRGWHQRIARLTEATVKEVSPSGQITTSDNCRFTSRGFAIGDDDTQIEAWNEARLQEFAVQKAENKRQALARKFSDYSTWRDLDLETLRHVEALLVAYHKQKAQEPQEQSDDR